MRELAPIALFAFNRPEHVRRTIESLKRCRGFERSPMFVFADGPRGAHDEPAVAETRRTLMEQLGPRAEHHHAPRNQGLARSIVGGVELLLQKYGRVIVVEDDLLLATGFLEFMNRALDHYADDPRVYQVSGHQYDVEAFALREQAVLLPTTTTWGWATWARAWRHFDDQAMGWQALATDRAMRRRFNLDGSYDYARMLERQMQCALQSWGIRWYWSVFKANGLSCFPPRSLVANTGMDGSGTHGRGRFRKFEHSSLPAREVTFAAPQPDEPASADCAAVYRAIWRQNGGALGWALDRLRIVRWAWEARR